MREVCRGNKNIVNNRIDNDLLLMTVRCVVQRTISDKIPALLDYGIYSTPV